VVVDGALDEPFDESLESGDSVVDGAGRAPPPSDRPLRKPGPRLIVDGVVVVGAWSDDAGVSDALLSWGDATANPPTSTRPEATAALPAIRRARDAACREGRACGVAGCISSIVDRPW
jgi:hypothetical protein